LCKLSDKHEFRGSAGNLYLSVDEEP